VELRLDGERAGHSTRTLQRSAAVAGVHIEGGRHSVWSLPGAVDINVADGAIGADGAEVQKIGAIGDNDDDTGSLAPKGGAD
jgi:hypothetical protein